MRTILFYLAFFIAGNISAQQTITILDEEGSPIPGALVEIQDLAKLSDSRGMAVFTLKAGSYIIRSSHPSYQKSEVRQSLKLRDILEIKMKENTTTLQDVVVSADRMATDRKNVPISIDVLDAKVLQSVNAVSLADGLSYSPGVRIEYNCQNCGFSQVRLNGLDGAYTQILIDGQPMFSALNGVYGLEQIPTEMVERIEVVRGGGSSMYGGNAIAGTLNIITRSPVETGGSLRVQSTYNGFSSFDHQLQGHYSIVGENHVDALQVFGALRYRDPYQANPDALWDMDGDGIAETSDQFSEMTLLRNAAMGLNYRNKIGEFHYLKIEGHGLFEKRRGGDHFELEPHQTNVTEQLIHKIGGLQAVLDGRSANSKQSWTFYSGFQYTDRASYYGGGGQSPDSATRAEAAHYYGTTYDRIFNIGARYSAFIGTRHKITTGAEFTQNSTNDRMPGYRRSNIQNVGDAGMYLQYQWNINEFFTWMVGTRTDFIQILGDYTLQEVPYGLPKTNLTAWSPRMALMYKPDEHQRWRVSVSRGFRAPQAFDEDLHISTLNGTARFIVLSPQLKTEYSTGLTLGWETDFHGIGQTGRLSVDLFWTGIGNPMVTVPIDQYVLSGSDTIASLELKENASSGLMVLGGNIAFDWQAENWAFQTGWTIQMGQYEESITWYPGVEEQSLLRSPNVYGFALFSYKFGKGWELGCNATFTGPMYTPHDRLMRIVRTPSFVDVTPSIKKNFKIKKQPISVEMGCYNVFNQYQSDLEVGALRDANYIYGPQRPASLFVALDVKL